MQEDHADWARFERWLHDRGLGESLSKVTRIGGGASRQTWLVAAQTREGQRLFALRMDTPGGGGVVPTTLAREYTVLRELHNAGVLVPKPLAIETDDTVLGEQFYVREGFEGTAGSGELTGAEKTGIARQLAGELAHLHALDVDAVEIPDRPERNDNEAAITWELDHWFDFWRSHDLVSPALVFIYRWLRHRVPSRKKPICVLWGDVGLANVIASHDGSILGLSDWELATYGDPHRDVASGYWRGLGRWLEFNDFQAIYRSAGGVALDWSTIEYYQVFMNWQVALFTHCAGRSVGTGRASSLHPALLSTWLHRVNIGKALKIIARLERLSR